MEQRDPQMMAQFLQFMLQPWHEAVESPAEAQLKVLKGLLEIYAQTDFGNRYGAGKIEDALVSGADQPRMQAALRLGVVGHCLAQRGEIPGVDRIARARSGGAQVLQLRALGSGIFQAADDHLVHRRRLV